MPDFHAFLTRLPYELAFSQEDPATIVDRYHTPDLEYRADGVIFDRRRLIDHAAPARKNARELDVEVHETLIDGDRAAARYTMTVRTRKDKALRIEVHLFAQLAPDGRVRRVDSLTRTVTP
ncbi:nuclear transport factor 2 family protein [Nonomuraea rhodomycinica]|uniref:Nuclear transport factor 2 family protein n=1 Tax=Nonomuraea rhodomycinica TaxID=1712872 RepID=A0A7Y6ITT9_9ACTN|nr:nuclear transport factor 2 family protein [Nonomuraea rhodomycinica]NUW44110.1 nuclear transport factor 2 family protein [Nonomuraea rhodomycinica]